MPTSDPDPDPPRWRIAVHRRCPLQGLERGLIQRAARRVLLHEDVPPCEVSVLVTGDAQIRDLNREWRGIDKPTDVLSFPQWESLDEMPPGAPLGDLIISAETAMAQAASLHTSLDAVVAHLVVHGALHLLGYDHARKRDLRAMRAREAAILGSLGLEPVLWPEGEVMPSRERAAV